MLSFEDLIKHLCHDCDVREIFSFASRPSYPIRSFHRSFPAEIYQYHQLDRLSLSFSSSLLLRLSVSFFFAITSGFGPIQFPSLSSLARILNDSPSPSVLLSFVKLIIAQANVLYLSDTNVCTYTCSLPNKKISCVSKKEKNTIGDSSSETRHACATHDTTMLHRLSVRRSI